MTKSFGFVSCQKDTRISNLRILCIILVAFAHSIIIYKDGWGLYNTNNQSDFLNYLCQFIYLFHMPLFFSISGYLVGYSYKKKPDFKNFMVKKIKRLIIPFLCIGLLYMIPIRYIAQYPGYTQNSFVYNIFVNFLLGKDSGHLWFLPTLLFIFVLHYFLNKYIKNEIIIFGISVALFSFSFLFPSYFGNIAANLIWFHLGYLINKHLKRYDNRILKCFTFIVFMATAVVYFFVPEMVVLKKTIQFIVALSGILFLYMSITDRKPSKFLSCIEKNSFGIYLLHSPLLYLVFCFYPDIHPLLMIFLNFFILGSFAFGLSIALRKTKLKFMLGE